MDKKFVEEMNRKLEQDLKETKQKMQDLLEELTAIKYFVKDKSENQYIIATLKNLYRDFKNEKKFLCTTGIHIIMFNSKVIKPDIVKKLQELQKLIEGNCDIFVFNPVNYYNHLLDSKPVYFEGDIVITDPCYFVKDKDWRKCDAGYELDKLGFTTFMTRDTLYGDWSCTVYNADNPDEKLGEYCADAGLVTVALLDDIRKHNPSFEKDYLEKRNWCAACIKDFKGVVQFVVKRETYTYKGKEEESFYVEVVGSGVNMDTNEPINFVTSQTGL